MVCMTKKPADIRFVVIGGNADRGWTRTDALVSVDGVAEGFWGRSRRVFLLDWRGYVGTVTMDTNGLWTGEYQHAGPTMSSTDVEAAARGMFWMTDDAE